MKLTLNLANASAADLSLAQVVLAAAGAHKAGLPITEVVPESAPAKKKPAAKKATPPGRTDKAKIKQIKETKSAGTEKSKTVNEVPEPNLGSDEPLHTEDSVRAAMAKKVKTHRDDIKAKLTDLEAKKVGDIKQEDYPAFMEFLEGLKDPA